MPLRDHFHPPLYPRHHWQSFLSSWATRIADLLIDRWLPPDFLAEEHIHSASRREIDVTSSVDSQVDDIPSPIIVPPPWTPPAPAHAMPAVFPDSFEVRVFSTMGGRTLVGAIELVSPGNKDRPDERRAFATKCASYLHQGVSLIIMDIVTSRRS
ncbi:MAG TPA: DUF4058 domain-containing protein, partial [Gemmataceae bacterium]|nr:DUF4058 domain-containing protein [Gemmataceae bacterium]